MRQTRSHNTERQDADLAAMNTRTLYRNSSPALVVSIFNTLVFAAFAASATSSSTMAIWAAVMVGIAAIRLVMVRQRLKSGNFGSLTPQILLTIISGIGWGLPFYLIGASPSAAVSYLMIFMVAGMSAAAALSFSSSLRIVLAYNVPLLTMTSAHFVLLGGLQNNLLAAIILLYLVTTTSMAQRSKRSVELAHINQQRAESQAVEIAKMADDLKSALGAAEAATVAKSRFLANMSHEIRTPLNGVLGMVQVLENSELTAQQKTYVGTIRSSGRALLGVIEDVLDFSRIESGSLSLETAPFSLGKVIQRSIDTVTAPAAQKGLALTSSIDPELADARVGDPQRIQQVLINLLGNAVKFTQEGSVSLRVIEPTPGTLCFEVKDTGPGLTPEQCSQVFERFAQADNSSSRKHGGAGLGLAISGELAALMQGRIEVESTPGEGCCFRFELPVPCDRREEADDATASDETARTETPALTILSVDDTQTNQLVARAMLEQHGHRLVFAENGAEAIETLEHEAIDLVLMDIQMPVMCGDEAIERIRASGKPYAQLPIIAVTANATSGERERLLALGASEHASKPFQIDVILEKISALTNGDRPTSLAATA
ncbi:MAG: ATP-binding protein [Pseudomonadota bacterium]|nr:ATP-binding protein [Pseudomonadota bacterium]